MNFKELVVWQKSIELAKIIYKITGQFPKSELYGLGSQMQRAAVGIASNIAEGYGRNHRAEYIQFLGIAYGSAAELETQLTISKTIYSEIDYTVAENLLLEIQKMLATLLVSLKKN